MFQYGRKPPDICQSKEPSQSRYPIREPDRPRYLESSNNVDFFHFHVCHDPQGLVDGHHATPLNLNGAVNRDVSSGIYCSSSGLLWVVVVYWKHIIHVLGYQGELLKKFAAAYRMFSDMDDHAPRTTSTHSMSTIVYLHKFGQYLASSFRDHHVVWVRYGIAVAR